MLTSYAFLAIIFTGYFLSLLRGPFWGLLVYACIYLVAPVKIINWWAEYLPFARWSLITSSVLALSFILHMNKSVKRKFLSINWLFSFFLLTLLIIITRDFRQPDMLDYTYKMFTYCVIIYIMIRGLQGPDQYRIFLFVIIVLTAYLSINAYLYGERIHARLEGIGTADAFESNEFALLLVNVIPFTMPFLFYGKWYEKIVCLLAMPFLFNAFILCNSRGALVAMVLAIVYGFFYIANKRLRKIILIGSICGLTLMIYLSDTSYIERTSTLLVESDIISDEQSANILSSGRIEIWKYGFSMVNDNPFGAGPNGFKQLAHLYMPEEILNFEYGADYGIRAAHNTYLQVLVEQGFLGLIIWLGMCFYTLRLLRESAKKVQQLNMSDSFTGLNVVALNMSFFSTLAGGLVVSRVYYEFFWWQVAFSVLSYIFISEIENKKINDHDIQPNQIFQN